jgi:hypothetical protein
MEAACRTRVMPRIHQRFRPSSEKCPAVILLSHSHPGRFRPGRHVACAFSFRSRCARSPDGRSTAASTRAQQRFDGGVGARCRRPHGRANRARSAALRKLGLQLEGTREARVEKDTREVAAQEVRKQDNGWATCLEMRAAAEDFVAHSVPRGPEWPTSRWGPTRRNLVPMRTTCSALMRGIGGVQGPCNVPLPFQANRLADAPRPVHWSTFRAQPVAEWARPFSVRRRL